MGKTRSLLTLSTRKGKTFVAGMIVVFATIVCVAILSVSAFATGIGEDLLDYLFGNQANIPQENFEEVYPTSSFVLNENFTEVEKANEDVNLIVNFANNYTCDEVKELLAQAQTKTIATDTAFEFTFGIDQTYGAPTLYFDSKLGLTCTVDSLTNTFKVKSEVGISQDTSIEARYGDEIYPYTLHVFYEDADGNWQTCIEDISGAPVGTSIPTDIDKAKAESFVEDFENYQYDAQSSSAVTEDGAAVASLYYRRNMIEVSFDDNGGYGGPGSFSLRVGSKIPEATEQEPARGGYTFEGWCEPESDEPIVIPESGYVVPSKDIVLHAKWELVEGPRYVTVVYWGQNAELTSDSFSTDDYSYISEAYILSKNDFSEIDTETFGITQDTWAQYIHPYIGTQTATGSTLREVEAIDADNTGSADVPIEDCYDINISTAHYDADVTFRADNYASYNVYLPRKTYSWDFNDKSNTKIDTITARWNQDILSQYQDICEQAWGEGKTSGQWQVKKVTDEDDNVTTTYKNMFTHMNRSNRTGVYKDDGTGGFLQCDEIVNGKTLRYYTQKVDAGTSHGIVQTGSETSSDYDLYASVVLSSESIFDEDGNPTDFSFSEEEFINIEGFITPQAIEGPYETFKWDYKWSKSRWEKTYTSTPHYKNTNNHAPALNQLIDYNEKNGYSGWNMYYQRAEHKLWTYIISPSDDYSSESDYFDYIDNIDYGKKIGDIVIPSDFKGKFIKDGEETTDPADRLLRYYVPENPGYGSLDSNYVFNGWALNNAVDSKPISLDDVYMGNGDLTIYAKWIAPEVNLTFHQVVAPKTEISASTTVLPGTYNKKLEGTIPTPTTFENYYFEYWYYKDGDQHVYFNPSTMNCPPIDLELWPEYSCSAMEPECSVTVVNNPLTSHGQVDASNNPIYAVVGTIISINENNKLIVEDTYNLNWGDEVTATGLTDPTGTYTLDHWEVNKGSSWETLVSGDTITGNISVRPVFVWSEESRAEISQDPIPAINVSYTGEPISSLTYEGAARNGYLKYAVSYNVDEQPDWNAFSTTVPTMTNAGNYYIYYYAEGDLGYVGSEIRKVVASVTASSVTATVKFTETSKKYTGNQIVVKDKECYVVTVPEGTEGFDDSKVDTDILLYVVGTEVGSYTGQTWDQVVFSYNDPNFEVTFERDTTGPTTPTLTISDKQEIPVPTWIPGSLTYNGRNQDPTRATYWNGYDTSIMSAGASIPVSDAGDHSLTFHINDSSYSFPGGAQSASATFTIDQLDMEIWAAGLIVYKDSEGAGQATISGSECFGADAVPMAFFDKTKLHATIDGEEISITARSGKTKDSNWLDNYEWSYDDLNINVTNINVSDEDYTTLCVDMEGPVVTTPPTIYNNITYDGEAHSAFETTGELQDGESYHFAYYVGEEEIAPAEDGWVASIDQATVTEKGTYYAWYAVYVVNEHGKIKLASSATYLGDVKVDDSTVTEIAVPEFISDSIKYNGYDQNCLAEDYWNNFDSIQYCNYDLDETSGTDVGSYELTLTPKADYVWADTKEAAARVFSWNIAKGTPQVTANPTLGEDFVYDAEGHTLVTSGAEFNIYGVDVEYGFTKDASDTAPEEWVSDYSNLLGTVPGYYYIWVKVDGTDNYYGVEPTLVMASDETPAAVACDGAFYFVFYEEESGYALFISYCPADQAAEIGDDDSSGFIPVNTEYTSVEDVPWHNYMNQIVIVEFNEFDTWVGRSGTKYISNWFNGASLLRMIGIYDDAVFANFATSVNVFNGCTSLVGGNGTAYDPNKTGPNMARFDYVDHEGYLLNGAMYQYDGNGAEIETQEGQMIPVGKTLTVTGVKNYFAPKTPVWEGHNFLGWTLDDPEGQTVLASDTPLNTAGLTEDVHTFYAQWEDAPEPEVITKPVKGDDFVYDGSDHSLFSAAGEVSEGSTMYYNYSLDTTDAEFGMEWTSDFNAPKGNEWGTYYLWYRLDEDGDPQLLVDDSENPVCVSVNTAGYKFSADTITFKYYLASEKGGADAPSDDEVIARSAYAQASDIPWYSVMSQFKVAYFAESMSTWTHIRDKSGFIIGKADISHWFDGASSLEQLKSNESMFFDTNFYYVSGSNVFVGCTKLMGGNGTKYSEAHSGVDYLHDDFAGHVGYLTDVFYPINIRYDYNGGSGKEINNNQYVYSQRSFTVTGVNNAFASAVPTKEGNNFAGWLVNGHVYESDASVPVSEIIQTSQTTATLVAQWEPVAEKEDNPFTFDPEEPWVLQGGSMLIQAQDVKENAAMSWEIIDGDAVTIVVSVFNFTVVTGVAEGEVTLQATSSETQNYKETVKTVTVRSSAKQDQNITLKGVEEDVYVDEFGSVEAIGLEEKPDVVWTITQGSDVIKFASSATSEIVNYKGLKGGTATLTITTAPTAHYNAASASIEVEIKSKIEQEITFDQDSYSVNVGANINATALGLAEGRVVKWEVVEGSEEFVELTYPFNRTVCITGLKAGTATIKVSAEKSQYYAESSATTTVEVKDKPLQELTFDKESLTLDPGMSGFVTVSGIQEDADFEWRIEDDSVATITSDFDKPTVSVKAVATGSTKLIIDVQETENYGETVVDLDVNVNSADYVLLKNRDASNLSIIDNFNMAKTVSFTHDIPTVYEDKICIDNDNAGLIYAYKIVNDDKSVDVKIASQYKIAANSTSFAGLFKNFLNLESVDFGDVIVDNATSLQSMFNHCVNLESVNLSSTAETGFNTSNVTSFAYMFQYEVKKLTNIYIGEGFVVNNNANLTEMFRGCISLSVISVPEGTDWRQGSGESTGMFNYCSCLPHYTDSYTNRIKAYAGGLGYFTAREADVKYLKNRVDGTKSIIAPYADAKSIKFSHNIPTSFEESINVDAEDLGSIKAYKVNNSSGGYDVVIASTYQMAAGATSLEGMCKHFVNLESIDFGDLNVDSAKSMKVMFSGCKALTFVDFSSTCESGFNTSKVNNFAWMFDEGCNALARVTCGPGFVLDEQADLRGMFSSCSLLSGIIVEPGTDWSKGDGPSSDMFLGCTSLPNFVPSMIDRSMAYCGGDGNGYLTALSKDNVLLKNRAGSDSIIKAYSSATSVEFGHNVPSSFIESINLDLEDKGLIKAYKVDNGKGGYKVVIASQYNIAVNARSFEGIFKYFANLESVDFGDVDVSEAKSFKVMFAGCKALKEVSLVSSAADGFDTSNVSDFTNMFSENCEALIKVTIGNGFVVNPSADISWMFEGCSHLSDIIVPEGTDWSAGQGASTEMFKGDKELPYYSDEYVDRTKAHCNEGGYFKTSAPVSSYVLMNRPDSGISIIQEYSEATSVEFTHQVPSNYDDYIYVDKNHSGSIKAYKVITTAPNYKVVICADQQIHVNVSSFAGIFKLFTNLTSVNFGDIDVSQAESLKGMFYGCSAIQSIVMTSSASGGFDTSKVSTFANMFDGASALVTIDLGTGFIPNSTATLQSMFDGCVSLNHIYVADDTTWVEGTGGSFAMFKDCKNLPGYVADKTDRNQAFVGDGGYFSVREQTLTIINNRLPNDKNSNYEANNEQSEKDKLDSSL